MSEPEALERLQGLLGRLERSLAELEAAGESDRAVDALGDMAGLAREIQAEIDRARREAAG